LILTQVQKEVDQAEPALFTIGQYQSKEEEDSNNSKEGSNVTGNANLLKKTKIKYKKKANIAWKTNIFSTDQIS
jgi:hypothetical protein